MTHPTFLSNRCYQWYAVEFLTQNPQFYMGEDAYCTDDDVEQWWWRVYPTYNIPHAEWRTKLPYIQAVIHAFNFPDYCSHIKPF